MPRGGKRPGAGRKPKFPRPVPLVKADAPAQSVGADGGALLAIEEFEAPATLTAEERTVWDQQAPHAFLNRTLTRASAMAFERYCRVVVLERNEAKSSGVGGSNHRGLLRQINAYELQFVLTPCGKPMPDVARTVTTQDEDEEFFGGPRGVVAG